MKKAWEFIWAFGKLVFTDWRVGAMIALMVVILCTIGWLVIGTVFKPHNTSASPQQALSTPVVQTTEIMTPVAVTPNAPTNTRWPTVTTTPTPWRAAKYYSAYTSEIPVTGAGLTCSNGVTFTAKGDTLVVQSGGTSYSIDANDQLFANWPKWAVLIPVYQWGVTYLDSTNGIGQSSKIVDWKGWVIDDRHCVAP